MNNLVDTLDEYLKLYIAPMTKLLKEYPSVKKAYNFIGRDQPSALPVNSDDRGYTHEKFEKRSKELLEPLIQKTYDLQKSSKILKKIREPVKIDIIRTEEGFELRASANNRLGTFWANRYAMNTKQHKNIFITIPANFHILTVHDNAESINEITKAAKISFEEAVKKIIENKTLINHQFLEKDDLLKWLKFFPLDDNNQLELLPINERGIILRTKSNYQPTVIFADEKNYAKIRSNLDKNGLINEKIIQKFEDIILDDNNTSSILKL